MRVRKALYGLGRFVFALVIYGGILLALDLVIFIDLLPERQPTPHHLSATALGLAAIFVLAMLGAKMLMKLVGRLPLGLGWLVFPIAGWVALMIVLALPPTIVDTHQSWWEVMLTGVILGGFGLYLSGAASQKRPSRQQLKDRWSIKKH